MRVAVHERVGRIGVVELCTPLKATPVVSGGRSKQFDKSHQHNELAKDGTFALGDGL